MIVARSGAIRFALASANAIGGVTQPAFGDVFEAVIPIDQLRTVAAQPSIRFVSRVIEGQPDVVSEGVNLIGASGWHTGGIDGTGVKIAVIDLGFSGYVSKLGTELPASVTTMNSEQTATSSQQIMAQTWPKSFTM